MARVRLAVAVAVGVLVVSALSGCGVTSGGDDTAGTIVQDGHATIDLRKQPTRREWGFAKGDNANSYQPDAGPASGEDRIPTSVRLPTGVLTTSASLLAADTLEAGTETSQHPIPPLHILVQRQFRTWGSAQQSLTGDAAVLGLSSTDLSDHFEQAERTGESGLTRFSLDGFVQGWLSTSVEVAGYVADSIVVNYDFEIGYYHNAAVDRVVHNGRYRLDLTHHPSRADLAYRPYFTVADIYSPPGRPLTAELVLPSGTVRRSVDRVSSTARSTFVYVTAPGSVSKMRHILATDAPALGVDRSTLDRFFKAGGSARLRGRDTDVYDVEVRADVGSKSSGDGVAGLIYVFTYHH